MKLHFLKPYKSITEKEDIEALELSDLNIITGVNGGGKTHLLQALLNGCINIPNTPIELFDFQALNFRPGEDKRHREADSTGEENRRKTPVSFLAMIERELGIGASRDVLSKSELNEYHESVADLILEFNDLLSSFHKTGDTELYAKKSKECIDVFWNKIPENIEKNPDVRAKSTFYQIALIFPQSTCDDKDSIIEKLKYDSFSPTIMGAVLTDEIIAHNKEKMRRFNSTTNAAVNAKDNGLVPSYDISQHPINEFNKFLNGMSGVHFSLRLADDGSDVLYAKMRHGGAEIRLEELSSGEQILLGLATFLYDRKRRNQGDYVLLLDEVDTNLHPSMIRSFFSVITGNFIKQHGIKVIMVTHSPTTIAEAPETASLFTMRRRGEPGKRIEGGCKATALRALTEGFVSMTHEESEYELIYRAQQAGKPVLFVEGTTDEMILRAAWEKLNPNSDGMPFLIIKSYGVGTMKTMFTRQEVFQKSSGTILVGLVDFDEAGRECWRKLKNMTGYHLVNKDLNILRYSTGDDVAGHGYFTLLPVPARRRGRGADLNAPDSDLTIELLFPDEVVASYAESIKADGAEMLRFKKYKKREFAEMVGDLPRGAFDDFVPLFSMIQDIIDEKYK